MLADVRLLCVTEITESVHYVSASPFLPPVLLLFSKSSMDSRHTRQEEMSAETGGQCASLERENVAS